jgi:hypothetical protein
VSEKDGQPAVPEIDEVYRFEACANLAPEMAEINPDSYRLYGMCKFTSSRPSWNTLTLRLS